MSDTEGMVRVMEHAAATLQTSIDKVKAYTGGGTEFHSVQNGALAAMAYARAVLQMVAASCSPEGRSLVDDLVSNLIEGDDEVGYTQWAEKEGAYQMSDGELAAVGRYLRSLRVGERS
jgi:hypothetical protein